MLISAKDVIVKSIQLYKDNAKLFFTYMGALFVPLAVSIILGGVFSLLESTSFLLALTSIAIMALVYLASLWVTLTFVRVTAARYEGKKVQSLKQEMHAARPLLWPSILVSILAALAIFGGMLLLIIPGIIFSIWFAFAFSPCIWLQYAL